MEFKTKDVKIIILSGKAGSGKSSIAKIINNYKESIILSYASYIKEVAKNVLNWNGSEEDKPRDFLQQFGDEIKKINPDLLINRVIEDIKVYSYFYELIIISDARFEREIKCIKDNFKKVYTINIYGRDNNLSEIQKNHITETSLDNYDKYDYKIKNDENVKEKIEDILKEIL